MFLIEPSTNISGSYLQPNPEVSGCLHFYHFHYAHSYSYLYTQFMISVSAWVSTFLPQLLGLTLCMCFEHAEGTISRKKRLPVSYTKAQLLGHFPAVCEVLFIYFFNLFYDWDFNAEPSRGVAEACCVGYSESWCFLTVLPLCVKQSLSLGILLEMGLQKSHSSMLTIIPNPLPL